MKTFLLIVVAIVGSIFLFGIFGGSADEEKEKAIVEKHCKTDFESLDPFFKEGILLDFAKHRELQKNTNGLDVSTVADALLKKSVKYPTTLLIGDRQEDYVYLNQSNVVATEREKGIITFSETFISENKLSMKVKGQFWMKIQYQAGCKPFKMLDFKIN